MASLLLLLILFLAWFPFTISQQHAGAEFDPNNHFVAPPPSEMDIKIDFTVFSRNIAYTVGQPLNFSWITDSQNVSLFMYQQGILPNKLILADSINSTTSPGNTWNGNYTWNGPNPFDFNQGRIFFLNIYDLSNSTSPKFRSHYFNLTDASCSTANITCPPLASSNNSCPPTKAVAIGAGVGGGAGGAILTVFAIFLLLPFFKKKGAGQQQLDSEMSASSQIYSRNPAIELPSPIPQKPVELPDRSGPSNQ